MGSSLLGFDIDFWDYVTFVKILLFVVAGVVVYCSACRAAGADCDRTQTSRCRGGRATGVGRLAADDLPVGPGVHLGLQADGQTGR